MVEQSSEQAMSIMASLVISFTQFSDPSDVMDDTRFSPDRIRVELSAENLMKESRFPKVLFSQIRFITGEKTFRLSSVETTTRDCEGEILFVLPDRCRC